MKRTHYIVKDITGEYGAIVQTDEAIYAKNTTEWIDEISVEDLDETSEGWNIITEEELEKVLDECRLIAKAEC